MAIPWPLFALLALLYAAIGGAAAECTLQQVACFFEMPLRLNATLGYDSTTIFPLSHSTPGEFAGVSTVTTGEGIYFPANVSNTYLFNGMPVLASGPFYIGYDIIFNASGTVELIVMGTGGFSTTARVLTGPAYEFDVGSTTYTSPVPFTPQSEHTFAVLGTLGASGVDAYIDGVLVAANIAETFTSVPSLITIQKVSGGTGAVVVQSLRVKDTEILDFQVVELYNAPDVFPQNASVSHQCYGIGCAECGVCSSRGTCIGQDVCDCAEGFGGATCNETIDCPFCNTTLNCTEAPFCNDTAGCPAPPFCNTTLDCPGCPFCNTSGNCPAPPFCNKTEDCPFSCPPPPFCNETAGCLPPPICAPGCENDGQCVRDEAGDPACLCSAPFHGEQCEFNVTNTTCCPPDQGFDTEVGACVELAAVAAAAAAGAVPDCKTDLDWAFWSWIGVSAVAGLEFFIIAGALGYLAWRWWQRRDERDENDSEREFMLQESRRGI